MKIVNLEQGTKEWLDWRKFGITATDAYTIMGHGFETPFSLWEVKTGKRNAPDINNVPVVKYGREHECDARAWWESLPENIMSMALPLVIESDENPIFKASLDGFDAERNLIIEFKCPMSTSSTWKEISEKGEKSNAYKRYWVQIQHQMMCAGADSAELVFFNAEANTGKIFKIVRDDKFINELKTKEIQFWNCVANDIEPPKGDKDVSLPKTVSTEEYMKLMSSYDKYTQEIAILKEKIELLETVRKPIIEELTDIIFNEGVKKMGINGYNVTLVERTTTDYKKLVSDYKISEKDLQKYEKSGKPTLKVTIPS